jgi:hypothetical protein
MAYCILYSSYVVTYSRSIIPNCSLLPTRNIRLALIRSAPASKAARSLRSIPNSYKHSCWLIPREVRLTRTRLPPLHFDGRSSRGEIYTDCGVYRFIGLQQRSRWYGHSLRSLDLMFQPLDKICWLYVRALRHAFGRPRAADRTISIMSGFHRAMANSSVSAQIFKTSGGSWSQVPKPTLWQFILVFRQNVISNIRQHGGRRRVNFSNKPCA